MKIAVVYTMKGCPYCVDIKEQLRNDNVPFLERDIDEHEEEFREFILAVGNDYVPSLMLLTLDDDGDAHNVKLLSPDRDYKDIYEGIEMIKNYLSE